MAQVFISYRREDGREFSRRLRDDLRGRGHDGWLDDEIRPGQLWTSTIEHAIDGSDAVVAVLSTDYHQSRIARMEIERAFNRGMPIIPLLIARGATPPLLLQSSQYIDFTEPDGYGTRLDELIAAIQNPAALSVTTGRPRRDVSEWNEVVVRAGTHTRRFLEAHRGTPQQPGSFMPELYVRRDAIEGAFEQFLDGSAHAFILIGEAGVGKTSALCHWAERLSADGHAVLPYDCSALPDGEIEREITRDLSIGTPDRLHDTLSALDVTPGKKLVVIFDSINEYRADGARSTETLLRRINAFVSRVDASRVRVAISCSSATWKHMERQGPLRLDWGCYFRHEDQSVVALRAFTPEEFDRAYPLYENAFDLFTPLVALAPELRDRLRDPVLLRLTAETYRGVKAPLVPANLALGIYRRFFEERVRHPKESWLVDQLAAEMLTRGATALSMVELGRHPQLGPEVLSEDQASTFARLLDRGVLQEWQADPRQGSRIKFAHSRVGAYAMALHLIQQSRDDRETLQSLLARMGAFPVAWDVALAFLLVSKAEPTLTWLADARDVEHRELACEALVQWHAEDAERATDFLRTLLAGPSDYARRTALKAAYSIGPQARDIFLRAAIEGEAVLREAVKSTLYMVWRNESPALRRQAADTLYVIWRHAPGFTYDVLNDLLAQISLKNVAKLREILEFVIDLSITIYINHCDNPHVIDKTADLYHELATDRLHLNLLNTGILGPAFENLVFRAVARAFSHRILDWMLFTDVATIDGFFSLPLERRQQLARVADALEPTASLESIEGDLEGMLQSAIPTFAAAAVLATAVHACRDFTRSEPVVRRLFDRVDATGRLWLLASFSVLLQETPPQWVPLLEALTRRFVDEHRDVFVTAAHRFLGDLDLVFLPLGLAYGKQGRSPELFHTLLRDALASGDMQFAARIVQALGPVGFYYPDITLTVIEPVMQHLDEDWAQQPLLSCLATTKTVHFDAVDLFLHRWAVGEAFARRVDAAADEALIRRYIHVVGYYNNAVHYTVFYPKMRRQLSMGALKLLATAPNPERFVADYTATAIRMFREADFQLRAWTEPE